MRTSFLMLPVCSALWFFCVGTGSVGAENPTGPASKVVATNDPETKDPGSTGTAQDAPTGGTSTEDSEAPANSRRKRVRSIREGRPPLGFTIPVFDLSRQTQRQTVVDREAEQYLGQPATLLLEDRRTMLAVYPKAFQAGPLVLKRSEDAGRTWSERLPVPKSWETSRDVPVLVRFADESGKKRVVLFTGSFPVRMSVSGDDGKNWSEFMPAGDFGGDGALTSVLALDGFKGHYLGFFGDNGAFLRGGPGRNRYGSPQGELTGFKVYQTRSMDGGLSWQDPVEIARHEEAYLREPVALRSPDGKQMALLLRNDARQANAYVVFSNDEGETWTEPQELPGALSGDRHVPAYAPDGRLFVTFRDTGRFSRSRGDWVAWVGRYQDITEGREGQYRVRLMDNHWRADCGYGGVHVLPDQTIVATGYGHWTPGEKPYIVSVRLKLAELDKMNAERKSRVEKAEKKK